MPVTPTYPGLYIEELPSDAHTIEPAPTSITVFVGYTHPFKTRNFNEAVQNAKDRRTSRVGPRGRDPGEVLPGASISGRGMGHSTEVAPGSQRSALEIARPQQGRPGAGTSPPDPPRRSIWNPSSDEDLSCHTRFTCVGDDAEATSPVGDSGICRGTSRVHPSCATVKEQSENSLRRIMQATEALLQLASWQLPFMA